MEGGSAYRVQLLLERHHVLAASEGWNVGVRGDISLVGLGEAGGLRGWSGDGRRAMMMMKARSR